MIHVLINNVTIERLNPQSAWELLQTVNSHRITIFGQLQVVSEYVKMTK